MAVQLLVAQEGLCSWKLVDRNHSSKNMAPFPGTTFTGGGVRSRSFPPGRSAMMTMSSSRRVGHGGWGGEGSGRPSKGSLQCPHCDKCLLNRDTLARHVLHMHQEPLYASKCTLCNREYRTRNSLMVHMSRYHRKRDTSSVSSVVSSAWEGGETN